MLRAPANHKDVRIVFDLRRFHKDLQGLAAEETDRRHEAIVTAAIGAINGELLFGSHELRRLGNTYSVVSIDYSPAKETPSIERIDRQYVKDVAERAQRDVAQGDTTARLPKRGRFSKRRSAKSLSVKVRSRLRTATSTSCSIRRRTCTTFMPTRIPTVAYATSSTA